MSVFVCPVCGAEHGQEYAFCPECGCSLSDIDAVTVTANPDTPGVSVAASLKNQVQTIGQKAHKGISTVSNSISDRARMVSARASNIAVQEKVTESMSSLVNLMLNVSKDITKQVPKEMISAIDLEAEVNFVAFSIGVSIDLAELNKVKPGVEIAEPEA
ncbi:MAG: zinc ribbon domain-containing protein [Candidatus Bathyarchaeota archaeon]|nr:zinc ribbon domain-containing protein [Candidatus Bathyarchaeota archaeon]